MPPDGVADAAYIGFIFFPSCMLLLAGADPPADEFTGTEIAWNVAYGAGSFAVAFVLLLFPLVGCMPSKRLVCRP